MSAGAGTVFRRRFCFASGCGVAFSICRCCDRGHRYCSERCRQKARRQQCREANRKHQQSLEGKLDHRDRQRAYRERQRRRVTDHGSAPVLVSVTIRPRWTGSTGEDTEYSVCRLVSCIVCGRSGFYIETFFESG